MIYINIAMLLLEILSWQFDIKPGVFNWYANYASNMIFAWLTTSITCAWASYVDYRMFGSIERLRKRWFYIQPMIGNTILVIVNMFVPVVFSVSPENVYARQPMMWLIVLFNSMCLLYIVQLAYKNRTKIQKEIIFVILMFVCMPAVVAGLQVLIYGVFIMWPTMAIALVITYIFLETISTSREYLTVLFSRNRVNEYIDYMLSMKKSVGVIMIDLDMFKKINDTYGHHSGDEALRIFAGALKNVFSEERMVARYAGDEFIVVTKLFGQEKLEAYEKKLKDVLNHVKLEHTLPYDICFSMGYHSTDNDVSPSYEQMLQAADKKMYAAKQANRKKDL